jgi:hypothetical protein
MPPVLHEVYLYSQDDICGCSSYVLIVTKYVVMHREN